MSAWVPAQAALVCYLATGLIILRQRPFCRNGQTVVFADMPHHDSQDARQGADVTEPLQQLKLDPQKSTMRCLAIQREDIVDLRARICVDRPEHLLCEFLFPAWISIFSRSSAAQQYLDSGFDTT